MTQHHDEVSVHIDKKLFKSLTPTVGSALYSLGSVAAGYVLFKEVHGPGDDLPIANDSTAVELKNGDHFYSAKAELNPGND